MKRDNRGLTLVEVIVVVAIVAIFTTVITTYVISTSNFYRSSYNQAKVQMDAQDILDQLEDRMIDANRSVYYAYGSATDGNAVGAQIQNDLNGMVNADKTFIICNARDAGESVASNGRVSTGLIQNTTHKDYIYDIIDWKKESQSLYYIQKQNLGDPASDAPTGTETAALLSEHVIGFAVDTSRVESDREIDFQITMNIKGKEITNYRTVTLRNQIQVAAPGTGFAKDMNSYHPRIEIQGPAQGQAGQTYAFTTTSQDVRESTIVWGISADDQNHASIDHLGNVTLSEDASGTVTIQVSAMGLDGTSVSASAELAILEADTGLAILDQYGDFGMANVVGRHLVAADGVYDCTYYGEQNIFAKFKEQQIMEETGSTRFDPDKIKWEIHGSSRNTGFYTDGQCRQSVEQSVSEPPRLTIGKDEKGFLLTATLTVRIRGEADRLITTKDYTISQLYSVVTGVEIIDPPEIRDNKMRVDQSYTFDSRLTVSKPTLQSGVLNYQTSTIPTSQYQVRWESQREGMKTYTPRFYWLGSPFTVKLVVSQIDSLPVREDIFTVEKTYTITE